MSKLKTMSQTVELTKYVSQTYNNTFEIEDQENKAIPQKRTNFISKIFFWWVYPIVRLGNQREIEIDDIFAMPPEYESKGLREKLKKENIATVSTNEEKGQSIVNDKIKGTSLTEALFWKFGIRYLIINILVVVNECIFKILRPVCLALLLKNCFNTTLKDSMAVSYAYLYATAIVLLTIFDVLVSHFYFYEYQLVSMRIKSALCSLVHEKCLRLSQESLVKTHLGQIINFMSNDFSRFDRLADTFHFLWIAPIQAAITSVILYYFEIGISSLIGMGILFLFVPFQFLVGRIVGHLREKTAEKTDERVKNMSQLVSGMRVVKLYAWEKLFVKLINLCRRAEVKVMQKTIYIRAINDSFFFSTSKLIIFLIFLFYILLEKDALTADKVFLTVILFENLRMNMTWYFPNAIVCIAETRASLRRLEKFLLLDEIEANHNQDTTTKAGIRIPQNLVENQIDFNHVTVKWHGTQYNALQDISFKAHSGKLLAIVGPIGSGKSSLLHVILGELKPRSGICRVSGKMSYASQVPWLFSDGTIRQNILCGLAYNAQRYQKVIKVTALEKDFSQLRYGDQTAVGERGVTLSGGQKTRICLARCLYVEADIYLLDDPLSAVDSVVGNHIFEEAINRFLNGKIRVFVTHQLQYLSKVDEILVLKKGQIESLGTYEDLIMRESVLKLTFGDQEANLVKEILDSKKKEEKTIENAPEKTEKENRFSGSVPLSTYWNYLHAGAGYFSFILLVLSCVTTQVLFSASDYWLSIFTNIEQIRARENSSNSLETGGKNTTNWWREKIDTNTGIYVYSIIISCLVIFSFFRTFHFFYICTRSSINLHTRMLEAVVRAPISFFERNSVGRILNRFTKDLGCIDDQLPEYYLYIILYSLYVTGTIVVVSLVNPWLIVPVIIPAVFMLFLTKKFMTASRSLKRLEAISRSPVFTHVSSSLNGLTTLRAHRCQDKFQEIFDRLQDVNTSVNWILITSIRWFAFWTDVICVLYVTCVIFVCVFLRENLSGSEAGLVISSAIALIGELQWGIRQSTEAENQMTSVERIMEYTKLQPEAQLEFETRSNLNETWPKNGNIQFDNVSLQYRKTDQPVLKQISCSIKAKEKIGIVGRTGAGKSSLIAALFRLSEPEGIIIIDGVDIRSIGLHQLRSNISIIPQDPILFPGSLRKNLDPFNEHQNDELLSALENVKLKESIAEGLDFMISDGGSNLSVGEKQLVCLARAILRKNTILVLDEATANMDQKTDEFIQLTIREKFANCTVLTIAHRLNTIMDSDRIMVLDNGYIVEFDEPGVLLEKEQGMFAHLVEQAGAQSTSHF